MMENFILGEITIMVNLEIRPPTFKILLKLSRVSKLKIELLIFLVETTSWPQLQIVESYLRGDLVMMDSLATAIDKMYTLQN